VGVSFAAYLAHAARIAFAAGAMLAIGISAWIALGMLTVLTGVQSGAVVLIGFILVAVTGIAGGSYVSVRYITPLSVFHPVVAAAVLGLIPVGVILRGEAGFVRVTILFAAVAVAALAAFVSRSIMAPPNTSLERTRHR
jgi:hypothetical protein